MEARIFERCYSLEHVLKPAQDNYTFLCSHFSMNSNSQQIQIDHNNTFTQNLFILNGTPFK